ncbi:hypothetical protein [Thiobacillus sp.]|uniref:hypothetical protein n=1 Tax=Thiobacillus sp. TaxID=924 RepID=UPI0017F96146|nr:hypothetical protein [Thiobacillus sp.]MBC2731354.1 hypothetical protein [Thiobacillus sp.]MBC2740090.1 hypothetical protein [Thiobacillus sp.]MBC2758302.1 hypothetical protein [Thiobacillus sp.]
MSLTSIQRDQARYKGSAEIRTRKSYLKRSATAIRQLAEESTKDWSALHGVFTEKELKLIRAAGQLVDRATARLSEDIREADAIRADYEKRRKIAMESFATLPHDAVDDCIALIGTAYRRPLDGYELERFRTGQIFGTVMSELNERVSAAIRTLAEACASDKLNFAHRRHQILEGMPAMKEQHADLIRELNTLAVAEQMEKSI